MEYQKVSDDQEILIPTIMRPDAPRDKKYSYQKYMSMAEIHEQAESYLGLPHNGDYTSVLIHSEGFVTSLSDSDSLDTLLSPEKCAICIFKKIVSTEIIFNNKSLNMELNIKDKVVDITNSIFKMLNMDQIEGYTLFSLDGPEGVRPLDPKRSLVESTFTFSKLILKRCFFILSRLMLNSPTAMAVTYIDCKNYYYKHDHLKLNEDDVLQIAIYDVFACGKYTEEEIQNGKITLQKHVPPYFDLSLVARNKFIEMLQNTLAIQLDEAIVKYIGALRKINGFGSTRFHCQTIIIDRNKAYKDAVIEIGPINIRFFNENEQIFENINYGEIHRFITKTNEVKLNILNRNTHGFSEIDLFPIIWE